MRPEERDQAYLWDMREAARDILEFTRDIDFPTFASQKRTRFAVERQLLVIGEAASHVSQTFRSAHPEVPWSGIVGLRNVLAHDYDDILVERVWLVSQQNVPPLEKQLSSLLPDVSPEEASGPP